MVAFIEVGLSMEVKVVIVGLELVEGGCEGS